MKITQKTIAQALGVSVQAVSLALRDHPSVSEDLRNQVKAKAEALGYRKNPLVSALMASRGRETIHSGITTLAYVTFCRHLHMSVPSVRKQIFAGVCRRADELGFQVEEYCLEDPELSPKHLNRILMAKGIQAVLLAPPPDAVTSLNLDCSRFAVVALGHNLLAPKVHRVTSGIYEVFLEMMQELYAMGYRRPGLVVDPKNDENLHWQWGSLFEYTSRHLFSNASPLVFHQTRHVNLEATLQWLQEGRPDVVISLFPEVRRVIENAGLKIPEQVGYVSLHPHAGEDESCIQTFGEQIGITAIDMVTAHLYRNDRGIPTFQKNTKIEGAFLKKGSLRYRA